MEIKISEIMVGDLLVCLRDAKNNRWAIKNDMSCVWNKVHKDFEWEPQPSSRTEEYLEEVRFDLQTALNEAVRLTQEKKNGV